MTVTSGAEPVQRGWRRWSRRVRTAVVLIATTALTAAVSWVVTIVADQAQQRLSDPVVVTVESDPTRVSGFGSEARAVAVPVGDHLAPDPGPACRDLYPWARARSSLDAGRTLLHLFVRGDAPGQVVIDEIRAVVDTRQSPASTLELACLPEGELVDRRLTIDLDSPRPAARYVSEQGRPFGFTVQPGEVEAFLITATVQSSSVWWHLEIDVIDGDRRTTIRVDDSGRPFATTPQATAGRWIWGSPGWRATGLPSDVTAPPVVPAGQALPTLPRT